MNIRVKTKTIERLSSVLLWREKQVAGSVARDTEVELYKLGACKI